MNKIVFYISFYAFFIFQSFALSQWVQLNSTTSKSLYSIKFISQDTGFVAGAEGTFLKTTDGGDSWNQIISGTTIKFDDIFFVSERIGFIIGGYGGNGTGTILKTTNSGSDWFELNFDSSYSPNTIFCVDSNVIFVGGYTFIARSLNGGLNWEFKDFGNANFSSIYFINNNIGFATTSTWIRKTINGGESWFVIKNNVSFDISSVYFCNEDSGYVVGGEFWFPPGNNVGGGIKTKNGGTTWQDMSGLDHLVTSIVFIAPNLGYCCGYNMDIRKTTNGGVSWLNDGIIGGTGLFSIDASIPINGTVNVYAAGSGGLILKRTGISSVKPDKVPICNYNLVQNYPNPFNPTTTINYQIPELIFVTLKVYDVLGNEIATLVNEEKPAGKYNVEFRIDNLELTSGIYFYQLRVGSYIETKKMVLLK